MAQAGQRQPTTALGERLREAREARGLSSQAAADLARISTGYIHKLESGRVATPSPRVLERLGGALGVPYWTLMGLAGYVPEGGEPGEVPPPAPAARQAKPEPRGGLPTNERVVELLEAITAELAELRRRQEELAEALTPSQPATVSEPRGGP